MSKTGALRSAVWPAVLSGLAVALFGYLFVRVENQWHTADGNRAARMTRTPPGTAAAASVSAPTG